MRQFRLTLAYDGADLVGWQRQPSGTSVQALVEDVLATLDGQPVTIAGAGRTDAGVHALGQVASFSLARDIAPETLVRALNFHLPPSVRALEAAEVPPQFHARFSARSKTYRYQIWTGPVHPPMIRSFSWHVPGPLDVEAMDSAARRLEGLHDFAAFQSALGAAHRQQPGQGLTPCVQHPAPVIDADATHGVGDAADKRVRDEPRGQPHQTRPKQRVHHPRGRSLQQEDRRGEEDRVEVAGVVGVDRRRRHVPLVAIDLLVEAAKLTLPVEVAATLEGPPDIRRRRHCDGDGRRSGTVHTRRRRHQRLCREGARARPEGRRRR